MFTNLCSQAPAHGNQVHLKAVDTQFICQQHGLLGFCTLSQPQE